MPQSAYNFTNLGAATTSTGTLVIRSGPGVLASIQVNSTGSANDKLVFYDATTSSTGNEIATIGVDARATFWFEIELRNGLTRGISTSTADVTIAWD